MITAPPRERDRGMTLIELLVAMSLLAIVTTMLTALFISMSQTYTEQETQHDSSGQAAIGMRQIGQVIRAGTDVPQGSATALTAFAAAGTESLTIHAYFDPNSRPLAPTRVTLAVNSDRELVETRQQGRASGESWVFDTAIRERVIARDVARMGAPMRDGAVGPLFRYALADGTTLARQLTANERARVVSVTVSLAVQTTGASAPVQITRTVALPNITTTTEVP